MQLGKNIMLTSITQPEKGAVVIFTCPRCGTVEIEHNIYAPPPVENRDAWMLSQECSECVMGSITRKLLRGHA